ncbi:uncharacterized protein G2W53_041805 [Senna tora]|uniref:Uncharacterized protein n=1 Tax=Senna tora TaxID=362788 RepID=A0A834SSN9_9FABA|nr:uncharacterized protein G2W53_041805 [Senna tora]
MTKLITQWWAPRPVKIRFWRIVHRRRQRLVTGSISMTRRSKK